MEFIDKSPKIIILSGKAQSGKNISANIIKEYYEKKNKKTVLISYAFYLKVYVKEILGWDGNEETKPRAFLQNIGTDVIRKKIDERFLIKRLISDITVLSYYVDVVVVTDVRLPLEFEEVSKCLAEAQMALDRINTTVEFEADI